MRALTGPVSTTFDFTVSIMNQLKKEPPLLSEAIPDLAQELQRLLSPDHADLATQVPTLRIVDRCRCGDDFCAMFYTAPPPDGAYGPGHENVALDVDRGMMILDVVDRRIMSVEVLDRPEVRSLIERIVP